MIEQAIKDASRKVAVDGHSGKRIVINLENILPHIKGNILEIGGGKGECTVYFCNVADSMNRRVLVVDPFEDGWKNMPESYRYPYQLFKEATDPFGDTLILHREHSQNPSVRPWLKKYLPVAFGFADGLQTYDAVISDLRLMNAFKIPIICVDDQLRGDVPKAMADFISESKYKLVETEEDNREAYLIGPNYIEHE